MTCVRRPVLTCDAANCETAIWTLHAWTIVELRRKAKGRGWTFQARKDRCPLHSRQAAG